jgi:hypothetical protein
MKSGRIHLIDSRTISFANRPICLNKAIYSPLHTLTHLTLSRCDLMKSH